MQKILITAAALVMVVVAEAAKAAPLRCSIDEKFVCNEEGCEAVSADLSDLSYNLIDEERRTFTRCYDKECQEWPAIFESSGAFTSITFASGAFAKLSNPGVLPEGLGPPPFHLVEVVSLWFTVYVSYGTCSRAEP